MLFRSSTTVTVTTTGFYQIYYSASIVIGANSRIAIAVNGIVDASTPVSVLAAPGEISGDVILSLTAGNTITLRNISGTTLFTAFPPGVAAQLTIIRIS